MKDLLKHVLDEGAVDGEAALRALEARAASRWRWGFAGLGLAAATAALSAVVLLRPVAVESPSADLTLIRVSVAGEPEVEINLEVKE